jgi:hypothetical protein
VGCLLQVHILLKESKRGVRSEHEGSFSFSWGRIKNICMQTYLFEFDKSGGFSVKCAINDFSS